MIINNMIKQYDKISQKMCKLISIIVDFNKFAHIAYAPVKVTDTEQ